jgi:hypothetical protein
MGNVEQIRNTLIAVGTSPVVVSEEQSEGSAKRNVIMIVNTSTGGQKITISPNADAVAGKGIVLGAGGFYQDSADSGYIPTQTRISAISDLAGGTLSVHERIISKRSF